MPTVPTTGPGPKPGPDPLEKILDDLVADACADQENDYDAAFEQWRDEVETDPKLILHVVGREYWNQIAIANFNRRRLRPAGVDLNLGAWTDDAKRKRAATRAKKTTPSGHIERGLLDYMEVGGKLLGVCDRAWLEQHAPRYARKSRFLLLIAKELPTPTTVVREVVSHGRAEALFKLAKAA